MILHGFSHVAVRAPGRSVHDMTDSVSLLAFLSRNAFTVMAACLGSLLSLTSLPDMYSQTMTFVYLLVFFQACHLFCPSLQIFFKNTPHAKLRYSKFLFRSSLGSTFFL